MTPITSAKIQVFFYWHHIFPLFSIVNWGNGKHYIFTNSVDRGNPLGSLAVDSNYYPTDKHKYIVIFWIQTLTTVKGIDHQD
jgi:hypothetical protein